ncbi:MAG: cob(I)yrinic acid a,c-diamide adenosyltransferase [Chitinophagales bacterium]|nr:cob(I)yrinic acid a,c-diamide adenosyltransferase [Chitinophagales bacterium]
MKIYTKTGDDGTTALFGGERVKKSYIRVEAYGNIDELNSFLGALIESIEKNDLRLYLEKIQHILFNIGSVVATVDEKFIAKLPQLLGEDITSLEMQMDKMESELAPMTNFILPGGHESIARAHICRTVCRRAERSLVALLDIETCHPSLYTALQFLNRLSDYFFILSRKLAQLNGKNEVIWKKEVTL